MEDDRGLIRELLEVGLQLVLPRVVLAMHDEELCGWLGVDSAATTGVADSAASSSSSFDASRMLMTSFTPARRYEKKAAEAQRVKDARKQYVRLHARLAGLYNDLRGLLYPGESAPNPKLETIEASSLMEGD
ncbi:hypothetical protein J7E25_09835 [Agromyces sp. ISL-38]|uniref:hypothetical protein n=1 Tax=Agromyces sp. ISL-38 TaxID=2819107 RepID=UPI001BEC6C01|nr:hypothetical protein [Agromyces sp. ISL-38]MBT2499400.1 hypothetical protein [Agromyces sp. ISL-38]